MAELSSNSKKDILPTTVDRFFMNIEGLFQLISELVNSAYESGHKVVSPYLVNFAGFVIFSMDKHYVIRSFIEKSHKHWPQIRLKDEDFFIHSAKDVFVNLPLEDVNAFKDLFLLKTSSGEKVVTDDDRDAIWEYFESLVRISIHFLQENPKENIWGIDMEKTQLAWKNR